MKTAYERIVSTMREQGKLDNAYLMLGEMQSETVCMKGKLELTADDLLISDTLKNRLCKGDLVLLYPMDEEKYIIIAKVVAL